MNLINESKLINILFSGCILLPNMPRRSPIIGSTQDRELNVGLAFKLRSRQEGVAARPQGHHQETAQLVQVNKHWKTDISQICLTSPIIV